MSDETVASSAEGAKDGPHGAPASIGRTLARLGPRWPLVAMLLMAENLAIGFRIDAYALKDREVYGFEHMGKLATVLVIMAVATILLRGRRLVDDLVAARATSTTWLTWWLPPVHAAGYAALWYLSVRIFDSTPDAPIPRYLLGAWLIAAVTVPAALMPMLVAPRKLPGLLRNLAPSLGIGAASGIVAIALGKTSALLWTTLGHYTLSAAAWLLTLVTPEIVYDADRLILGTPSFVVHLAPVCSGFEGMGLITALLTGYLAVNRHALRFPQVLLIIPASIAAVWIANVGRIAALIVIGSRWSPTVAVGGFHSQAGWVLFCIIAMGAVLLIQSSPTLSRDPGHRRADPGDVATPYLLPVLALIATSMLTGLAAADVDTLYGLRVVAAVAVLLALRSRYRALATRPDFASVAIGVGTYALWTALVPGQSDAGTTLQARVSQMGPLWAPLWIGVRIAGSTLVVPLVEELAFRGYLVRRLVSPNFESVPLVGIRVLPVLVSSLAFGMLHGAWIAGTLAGVAYALAQARRGRTLDAVVAHATTNGLICLQVLALDDWGLWA